MKLSINPNKTESCDGRVAQGKVRTAGYWIATLLTALLFTVPGIGLLSHVPHFTEDMAHLGYPLYFLTFLGVWKVLGAITILLPGFPRLKEWAYAGMMFDICGAVVSRAVSGGDPIMVIVPSVIGGLVLISWALRPESRRLRSMTHLGCVPSTAG